jgi:DNA replication protein DnaC
MKVMPEATCVQCGGSGWRITEREGISGAERCDCAAPDRLRKIEAKSNIPPLYRAASVEDFELGDNPIQRDAIGRIIMDVRTYIRTFPFGPKPGLLLVGPPGVGKTHIAAATLRALIARGFEGVFFDFQNLLDRIRAGYDAASGTSEREAYRTALETQIVVLDDLGAHRVTDWVEDTVTSIVTHRCNHKMATIVTTNLRDPEAGDQRGTGLTADLHSKHFLEERIGMRARSRLFEMCKLINLSALQDYRLRPRR